MHLPHYLFSLEYIIIFFVLCQVTIIESVPMTHHQQNPSSQNPAMFPGQINQPIAPLAGPQFLHSQAQSDFQGNAMHSQIFHLMNKYIEAKSYQHIFYTMEWDIIINIFKVIWQRIAMSLWLSKN
jgi:hypothetical protein